MFWKQSQAATVVSRDGEQELFRFGAKELADIAYASAWPGSDELLLTATRTDQDRGFATSKTRKPSAPASPPIRRAARCSDE